jgi:predicted esterase
MENSEQKLSAKSLVQLDKIYLRVETQTTHAFCLYRSQTAPQHFAIFTHGYTADKGQQLNWAARLAELGFACLIFDLPGHYLGNFNDVESLDEFFSLSPQFFAKGLEALKARFVLPATGRILFGGHSLGAHFALKALSQLPPGQGLGLAVGYGLHVTGQHLFETPLYKSTLNLRAQLVSQAIRPEALLPRLKLEKEKLKIEHQQIIMLCGEDDAVVSPQSFQATTDQLIGQGNQVLAEKPKHLPHHQPELAAPHIKSVLKSLGLFAF